MYCSARQHEPICAMFAELRLKLLEQNISSFLQFGWYLHLDSVVSEARLALCDCGWVNLFMSANWIFHMSVTCSVGGQPGGFIDLRT
jgi:hypothetical protein